MPTTSRKPTAQRRKGRQPASTSDAHRTPIELTLFAPNNNGAVLLGSFSEWKEIPMKKSDDGTFQVTVDLPDGVHPYRFRVQSKSWFYEPDQWVDVIDPYATEIDGAGENGVLRIVEGKRVVDTYEWKHDDTPLPPDHELVIYELHVGDFSGGEDDPFVRGKFTDLIDKMDYLCDLGINAIELMPVKDNPGAYSWGYNPRHFFAPHTEYGTTEDLKRLVDICHSRGIRVFLDGVYGHSETACPLTQIDHDYWYRHDGKDKENNWGPEFNYDFEDVERGLWPARKFILDTITFWVREYHIDGIRYDASRQVGNFDVMRSWSETTKQVAGQKPFFNVAEYIPPDPAVTGVNGPMDACWHDGFYHCLKELLEGGPFDAERLKGVLDARRAGFEGPTNVVNYISNHDWNYVLADLGDSGIFDDAAFDRARLGAVLCMTAFGIPLLWMGEEFGERQHKSEESSKIQWSLLQNERNRDLFLHYKRLIALRKTCPALYGSNIDFFYEDAERKILAYHRWDDSDSHVVVVANLGEGQTLEIPGFPPGSWREWTAAGDTVLEVDPAALLELGRCEARVFVPLGAAPTERD